MAFLMFNSRINDLRSSILRHQERLTEITRKMMDLQQYSANIADGSVSIYDMVNTPSSMLGRTIGFMQYSHNTALQGAQFNYMQMVPMIQQQMVNADPQYQQAYMNWVQQSLYKQERERIGKMEEKMLNQQEKELQLEKDKLETLIKMEEQELESAKQARDKGIQEFKPNYSGQS